MSKKKKNKHNDYFNMTPEEQKANREAFHDYENGEISFLDALNYKVPTVTTSKSSYKKQIEMACFGNENTNTNEDDYVSEISKVLIEKDSSSEESYVETSTRESIPYSSIVKSEDENVNDTCETKVEEKIQYSSVITYEDDRVDNQPETKVIEDVTHEQVNDNTVEENIDNVPRLRFKYNNVVGKMIIDDGYVATPISIIGASAIELDEDNIPTGKDAFGHLLSRIYFYIISCKHPSVIMNKETFEREFSIFSKIDFSKFIFFKNNDFVYAYVLDANASEEFYSVIDIYEMSDKDILRYVVGTAYTCNTIHNIFMHNDEDEVDSVMNDRNAVKELINLIEKDPETEYAGHNVSRDTMSSMKVTDLQKFVPDVYAELDDLIVSDDDDDEEYDEDDDDAYDIKKGGDSEDTDDDDDSYSVEDFPDDENKDSDIGSMIDDIDVSDNDEDDDDNEPEYSDYSTMKIPVHHRK